MSCKLGLKSEEEGRGKFYNRAFLARGFRRCFAESCESSAASAQSVGFAHTAGTAVQGCRRLPGWVSIVSDIFTMDDAIVSVADARERSRSPVWSGHLWPERLLLRSGKPAASGRAKRMRGTHDDRMRTVATLIAPTRRVAMYIATSSCVPVAFTAAPPSEMPSVLATCRAGTQM
jgi:hypothetical protein